MAKNLAKNPDPDDQRPKRLPPAFYNTITFAGGSFAAICLGLILMLVIWEYFSHEHSPYMGVIAFVILPAFMILGLLVAGFGVARQLRRRHLGLPSTEQLPRIDLNNPAHLRAAVFIGVGGVIFLVASGFGSFKAYEYTDSDEFCGTMCHAVMKPEHTAYQASPHARVGCVKCHIGPGAEWFVKSKLSGAYQVYSVLFDKYPRPIETPIKNLRPSRETCEQCHWPAHFLGEKMVVHDYFGYEEGNTHWRLKLLMKTGGGGAGLAPAHGIHWHVAENIQISYAATDEKRTQIPWVRFVDADGREKIFRSVEQDVADEELAGLEKRTMDCIDCHNRPSHHYNPPARLVNRALSNGLISPELPGIKGLLVDLMEAEYATAQEAQDAIAAGRAGALRQEVSADPRRHAGPDRPGRGHRPGALRPEHLPGDEGQLAGLPRPHRAPVHARLLPLPRRPARDGRRGGHLPRLQPVPRHRVPGGQDRRDLRIAREPGIPAPRGHRRRVEGDQLQRMPRAMSGPGAARAVAPAVAGRPDQ